jgi:purine-binding chemotaxis protein CheW
MAGGLTEKHAVAREELLQLVSFNIGGEEIGVDILHVQEISRTLEATQVTNAPEDVVGVVKPRGEVIPDVDFRPKI